MVCFISFNFNVTNYVFLLLQSCFVIDEGTDDHRKKFVLRKAGKLMRKFRSDLVKFFLRDDNENIITTPPNMYEGIITQEMWDEFVRTHTTQDFQVK